MATFDQAGDPSLSESVGRRLMTPGGSVAPGIAPELFPCVVIENDRPEYQYLQGAGRYARGLGQVAAGGAGTRSSAQLLNTSEDTLIVVEQIWAQAAAGNVYLRAVRYGVGVVPTGTQGRGLAIDTRAQTPAPGLRQSQAITVTDNTLASSAATILWSQVTSLNLANPGFVIGPGTALYVSPSADNVALTDCNFIWRERRLNQSER